MLKFVHAAAAVAFVAGASGAALAQQAQPQVPAAAPAAQAGKSNEVICRTEEVTGSRLGAKRVCRTRAEWADAQLQDRQEVDRVQSRRGMKGN